MNVNKYKVKQFIELLKQEVEITVSTPTMFVSFYLTRMTNESILANQGLYTKKLISRFSMEEANAVSVPANSFQNLNALKEPGERDLSAKVPYREAVEGLLFLAMVTVQGIAYAVNHVSRHR